MGAEAEDNKPAEEFVSIARAVKESGISRATLMRWISGEKVRAKREPEPNGEWRVWLPDVIATALGPVSSAMGEADEPSDDPKFAAQSVYIQTVGALRVANKQVRDLLDPALNLMDKFQSILDRSFQRIGELEQKNAAMVDAYEQTMKAEHERRLQEDRQRREQDRLDDAFKSLTKIGPSVAMGLAGHFGLVPVQEGLLTNMLADLNDHQFAALASQMKPEQAAVLERLRATQREAAAKEQEKTNGRS